MSSTEKQIGNGKLAESTAKVLSLKVKPESIHLGHLDKELQAAINSGGSGGGSFKTIIVDELPDASASTTGTLYFLRQIKAEDEETIVTYEKYITVINNNTYEWFDLGPAMGLEPTSSVDEMWGAEPPTPPTPPTPTPPSAPTISGTTEFEESTQVTITAESGTNKYYTTNGNTPTILSTLYTDPFTLTETATVKAIAVKNGLTSPVASQTFTKTETKQLIAQIYADNACTQPPVADTDYTELYVKFFTQINAGDSEGDIYNFGQNEFYVTTTYYEIDGMSLDVLVCSSDFSNNRYGSTINVNDVVTVTTGGMATTFVGHTIFYSDGTMGGYVGNDNV